MRARVCIPDQDRFVAKTVSKVECLNLHFEPQDMQPKYNKVSSDADIGRSRPCSVVKPTEVNLIDDFYE